MNGKDHLKVDIKADTKEIARESADWTHLAQDTHLWRDFVNKVMNLRVL
jgi:hypothetical protein